MNAMAAGARVTHILFGDGTVAIHERGQADRWLTSDVAVEVGDLR